MKTYILYWQMIYRALFYTLLTVPLFFKIQVLPGIVVHPSDIVLIIILLMLPNTSLKINSLALPFLLLVISLTIIFIVTVLSQFFAEDLKGVLTTIKYLIYAISATALINNRHKLGHNIERAFLKVSLYALVISLGTYFLRYTMSEISWEEYVSRTTWWFEYMPTGLSNRVFELKTGNFSVSRGNHGIWGSYLAFILFISIRKMIETKLKKAKWISLLALINLSLITAREAYLLILVFILTFGLHKLLNAKFNKKILVFSAFSLLIITVTFIYNPPDITIIRKFQWMFESIGQGKFDTNIMFRVNTWFLYIMYLAYNPLFLFTGIGFNKELFIRALSIQEKAMATAYPHVDVPESFFVASLAYGGLFSLLFAILFFSSLFKALYNYNNATKLFSFFIIGLMFTNLTGASILAEMIISQLGVMICILTNEKQSLTQIEK